MLLEIKNLHVEVGGKEVLKGIDLKVGSGELHVIMGPNGSGKTTLAKAIVGLSGVKVKEGDILFDGKSIINMSIDERARMGIFMQYQNPVEIEGVSFLSFLSTAKSSMEGSADMKKLMEEVKKGIKELGMSEEVIKRPVNLGFSGGEKKKSEILQMNILKPKIAILDEPDSGLDVDAVKIVGREISKAAASGTGCIVITHYTRILSALELKGNNVVHVLYDGKIVENGGKELAEKIEKEGYSILH